MSAGSSVVLPMLKHKHYLQNRYHHTKIEEDRLSFRSWHKLVQLEFKQHTAICWNRSIDNITSSQPTNFCNIVKILNKKRSAEFSAIPENNQVHRTSGKILSCLTQHFKSRFASPSMDMQVRTDKETQQL